MTDDWYVSIKFGGLSKPLTESSIDDLLAHLNEYYATYRQSGNSVEVTVVIKDNKLNKSIKIASKLIKSALKKYAKISPNIVSLSASNEEEIDKEINNTF